VLSSIGNWIKCEPVRWEPGKHVAALKAATARTRLFGGRRRADTHRFGRYSDCVLPLAEIYPKHLYRLVILGRRRHDEKNPDLVGKIREWRPWNSSDYLKANPGDARKIYVKRTGAPRNGAKKAVASPSPTEPNYRAGGSGKRK